MCGQIWIRERYVKSTHGYVDDSNGDSWWWSSCGRSSWGCLVLWKECNFLSLKTIVLWYISKERYVLYRIDSYELLRNQVGVRTGKLAVKQQYTAAEAAKQNVLLLIFFVFLINFCSTSADVELMGCAQFETWSALFSGCIIALPKASFFMLQIGTMFRYNNFVMKERVKSSQCWKEGLSPLFFHRFYRSSHDDVD